MAKYKSIFISDVHLGSIPCKAKELDEFLKENTCENLYLVGDIIDGWLLKTNYYWPQTHSDLIRRFLTIARDGTNVYYISGNHDEFLRSLPPYNLTVGNIQITHQMTHHGIDGKDYLVVHGDMFDNLIKASIFKTIFGIIGALLYHISFRISRVINFLLKPFKIKRWSLSESIKRLLKVDLLPLLMDFEKRLATHAKDKGHDGIICGHIHRPIIKEGDGVMYMNDGDWVDSKSALVENYDGTFEIVYHE